MLSTETNECLISICGQIIKEVFKTETNFPRQIIWPEGTDTKVYSEFPDPAQSESWNLRFLQYLDSTTNQL